MEYEVLGWPGADVTLDLDHRRFAYAGKFAMSRTGKAVAREPADEGGRVVGAVAFDADRTDETTCRLRYVTVRDDRRGERVGGRLCAFVADRARERGFDRALIAVNNPFAYEAAYRAGFGYTGDRTGLAELLLERPDPTDRDPERYRDGMAEFAGRDLPPAAVRVVERGGGPPDRIRVD